MGLAPMRWHYVITPTGDFADVTRRLLEHVATDDCVALLQRPKHHVLMFCTTPALAVDQRSRFANRKRLSRSFATIEVFSHGVLRVNQESTDASVARMAPVVKWILEIFAPCQIFDEDAGVDITVRVAAEPKWLFE